MPLIIIKEGGWVMNEIITAISTCGFPIVMCLMLLWFIKSLLEKHQEESKEFTTALNNNTLVLQKLCDKLESVEDDIK